MMDLTNHGEVGPYRWFEAGYEIFERQPDLSPTCATYSTIFGIKNKGVLAPVPTSSAVAGRTKLGSSTCHGQHSNNNNRRRTRDFIIRQKNGIVCLSLGFSL